MDPIARTLRAAARRWPALRRRRWWFRPAYEAVLFGLEVVSLACLVPPGFDPGLRRHAEAPDRDATWRESLRWT